MSLLTTKGKTAMNE